MFSHQPPKMLLHWGLFTWEQSCFEQPSRALSLSPSGWRRGGRGIDEGPSFQRIVAMAVVTEGGRKRCGASREQQT